MDVSTEQQIKNLQLRDRVVRAMSKDGFFRITIIKNTNAVKEAQRRHQLDYLPSFLLARTMSVASMYASFLKGEERTIIEVDSNGPIEKIYVEAIQAGEVKGFIRFAPNSKHKKIDTLADALGLGLFRVSKILNNKSQPISSVIPLPKGDIATDMAHFFAQSEQIPTAVILDVKYDDKTGLISQSGGMFVQALPGHSKEQLEQVYEHLSKINSLCDYYVEELNPLQVLSKVLPFEFKKLSSKMVDFYCRCSKDVFKDKLVTLGSKELIDMKKKNQNELVCQYCAEKYFLTDIDFNEIITIARTKEN